jgi:hypothetical protein
MEEKEKLIQIIMSATNGCARYWAELIANKLLAEGVTITPSEQIRAEARREFAEKLKNYYIKNCNSLKGSINCDLVAYHIDQILADMERKAEQ